MTTPTPLAGTVRKLGPGSLSIGSAGSLLDFSVRCTSAAVRWSVDTEDDTPVLSGGVEAGDRTYTATLEATVLQDDLTTGGLVSYSWGHKGDALPAAFTPYTDGPTITGTLIVDPLDVGGDVGKKNTSDLKWAFVGEPELEDNLA